MLYLFFLSPDLENGFWSDKEVIQCVVYDKNIVWIRDEIFKNLQSVIQ